MLGDVSIEGAAGYRDSGYLWIASGYAVHRGRVLLVLHNRFEKWVPPGGHLQAGDTLSQTALREFQEETGLQARLISAAPALHLPDNNATPEISPFYCDIETEDFRKPALVHFYYVRILNPQELTSQYYQEHELDGIGLFSNKDLDTIPTFEQVRSLSRHAIKAHPDPSS